MDCYHIVVFFVSVGTAVLGTELCTNVFFLLFYPGENRELAVSYCCKSKQGVWRV